MGNWTNGARHGHGTLLFRSGARYCGEWKNDLRDGYGVMCYDPKDSAQGYHNNSAQVIFVGSYSRGIIIEGTLSTVYDRKQVSYVGKFKNGGIGDDSAWVCIGKERLIWGTTPDQVRKIIGKALERSIGTPLF